MLDKKVCKGACGEEKTLGMFSRSAGSKDGHRGVCTACQYKQQKLKKIRRSGRDGYLNPSTKAEQSGY